MKSSYISINEFTDCLVVFDEQIALIKPICGSNTEVMKPNDLELVLHSGIIKFLLRTRTVK